MDRRSFLAIGAALLATPWSSGRLDRIGIQLYSLRRELARDFEGTLARVADIGYTEVEFAGYHQRSPVQVKAALERAGLSAPSAHIPISLLREPWAGTLDQAGIMGHRYLIVPSIPEEARASRAELQRVVELFQRAGEEAGAAGIRLGFHNHDVEFMPMPGPEGRSPFDVLLEETDPAHLVFELDLYWITKAGRDPLVYFARHPGRFELVHVKDSGGPPGHRMVDVGRGTIDFGRIFARQREAGIRHFFVEHDDPSDPLGFARASRAFLRRMEF